MTFHCIRTHFNFCRGNIIYFQQVSPRTLLTTYLFDLPLCCSYLHHCSVYSIVFYIPSTNPRAPFSLDALSVDHITLWCFCDSTLGINLVSQLFSVCAFAVIPSCVIGNMSCSFRSNVETSVYQYGCTDFDPVPKRIM